MTYKTKFIAVAALIAFGAAAHAEDQFVANAGLTPDQAKGMTLNQIAAAKFNQGVSYSDKQAVIVTPGDAGVSSTELQAFAIENYNAGKTASDRQVQVHPSAVSISTRSLVDPSRHSQLIASAGLTPEEAHGMTLNQIVAAKNNRNVSFSDRQRVTGSGW